MKVFEILQYFSLPHPNSELKTFQIRILGTANHDNDVYFLVYSEKEGSRRS